MTTLSKKNFALSSTTCLMTPLIPESIIGGVIRVFLCTKKILVIVPSKIFFLESRKIPSKILLSSHSDLARTESSLFKCL